MKAAETEGTHPAVTAAPRPRTAHPAPLSIPDPRMQTGIALLANFKLKKFIIKNKVIKKLTSPGFSSPRIRMVSSLVAHPSLSSPPQYSLL